MHKHILMVVVAAVALPSGAIAQDAKGLKEPDLAKLIELQIDDATIVKKLNANGVAFTTDQAAFDRLKKAGASDAVLDAVRKAGRAAASSSTVPAVAVTYQDITKLLQLGIDEGTILQRLQKSPTVFVLDRNQIDELKKLGASDALLTAMQSQRPASKTAEISELVIVLDCSNSMNETTKDGVTKMEAARKVVTELVQRVPRGLYVAFIVYGHDMQSACQAVKVVRR